MMKAAQFKSQGSKLEVVQVPIPTPKQGWVRIKVQSCGVCHTDLYVGSGIFGNTFPRTPGHEVAGVVDLVGEGVGRFKVGDKVGVGWFGGNCGVCDQCHLGNWSLCSSIKTCGVDYDGGFAEYLVAPENAIARIPDTLQFSEAAPLLCAGVTTFNSIRNMGLKPGLDIVAIQGVGGLGHLAIQYSRKLGFLTVAVGTNADKEKLALELGADYYFTADVAVQKIKELGGAKVVVGCAPHKQSMEQIFDALAPGGTLLTLAAVPEISVSPLKLLSKNLSVKGWYSGDPRDSEATMKFSSLNHVKAIIQEYPIEKAQEAMDKIDKARFRSVLVLDNN